MKKMQKTNRPKPPNRQAAPEFSQVWVWVALAIVIAFYATIRMRLLSMPLERDEGEYAYAGQLILHGIPPYKFAYNMKLPGVYYAYALIMAAFGSSATGIHLGLLLVNAASLFVIFLIGKRLFDATAGIVAAAALGYLSLSPSVLGTQAHATHFVVLPALAGCLVLLTAVEERKFRHLFWSGILLGTAFVMKQQALFFPIFGFLVLLAAEFRCGVRRIGRSIGNLAVFSIGSILPLALIFLVLWFSGVFGRFWFWAVQYAGKYVSEISVANGLRSLLGSTRAVMASNYLLWLVAAAGLVLLWIDRDTRKRGYFLTGFFLFSFLSICPGFHFRQHYYVTWIPALALLIAAAVAAGANLLRRSRALNALSWVPGMMFAVLLTITIIGQADFLFSVSPKTASVMMYGKCPWTETEEIGKYLESRTLPDDTIAVLGSEPQLYFYSGRRAATGYIYTYGLMELQDYAHRMQMEMIGEIERARPKYIVFVSHASSWAARSRSDRTILQWQAQYCAANYRLAGFVQSSLSSGNPADYHTDYVWDISGSLQKPDPRLEPLYIFERK